MAIVLWACFHGDNSIDYLSEQIACHRPRITHGGYRWWEERRGQHALAGIKYRRREHRSPSYVNVFCSKDEHNVLHNYVMVGIILSSCGLNSFLLLLYCRLIAYEIRKFNVALNMTIQ